MRMMLYTSVTVFATVTDVVLEASPWPRGQIFMALALGPLVLALNVQTLA